MSERYIVIPSWDKHQHYKRQMRPAWIKLHTSLLHNSDWLNLTEGQRSALIGIWLIYASSGRHVAVNTASLSRQLGQRVTRQTLDALNHAGFIEFRSRDALEELYAREEKRRIESNNSLLEQLQTPRESRKKTEAEIVAERERSERSGYVENLSSYTGCRIVRGEIGIGHVYDPLGKERPPNDWSHERPSRKEILQALAEKESVSA